MVKHFKPNEEHSISCAFLKRAMQLIEMEKGKGGYKLQALISSRLMSAQRMRWRPPP